MRAEAEDTTGGQTCPSCEKALSKRAKICISCGINIKTGRPVLTSQGVDENSLYEGDSLLSECALFSRGDSSPHGRKHYDGSQESRQEVRR